MKKFIQKILYFLAKRILKKYHPEIIGITGSVGKTSTKEAIFEVLKNKFKVRQNIKNYNTELGVPLTIIGAKSGGKNFFKWLAVITKGLGLIMANDKNYPQILVLEMAADHPGDIEYLTKLAPCKIGVVTAIGPSHLEFFETIENVIKEKEFLISHLSEDGFAILNADDNLVYPLRKKTKARVLTFGLSEEAQIKASVINYEKDGSGLICKIFDDTSASAIGGQSMVPVHFKNVLSSSQLGALLAALTVARVYEINMLEATNALSDFKFPKGRLNLINGIKKTLIIDDTYNSSPKAVKVALEVLSRLECQGRRWAVLGDMLELGGFTENAHQQVGEWVKEFRVDILVTVGEKSKDTAHLAETSSSAGLTTSGLPKEQVISFDKSEEAGKFIQSEISPGDLILVKGSQGMRLEKIVKEIMAEPARAGELLVRQEKEWMGK